MFSGVGTAIITPMKNGEIDIKALEKIVNHQLENKIDAIFPCGTTGEIATFSKDEYEMVVETVYNLCKNKIKVIAGVGGNNTKEVIEKAKICERIGIDGILAVAPYYNKPNQEGLFLHFSELAKSTKLDIMLYNVPSRTITDILEDTTIRLIKEHKNIVAIKDATGLLERVADLRAKMIESKIPLDKFSIFCGDDATAVGFIAMGGTGLVSVASNFLPKEIGEMTRFAIAQNFMEAKKYQDKYNRICQIMFCETNPAPVKFAMSKLGFCENEIRLPLARLSKEGEEKVESEMKKLKLI